MHISKLITAAILPLTAIASQVPIIGEKERLSKVISDSLYLSLHKEICEIASTTNIEYDVGRWLQKFLEGHHFVVVTQEIPPRAGTTPSKKPRMNIYTYPDPKHYKSVRQQGKHTRHTLPKVLLTSHIDTVPPHIPYSLSYNYSSPGPFNRSNVLISGRGTVDAKASVAAQLTAAMTFLIEPPKNLDFSPADMALLFVVDEESGGMGMGTFNHSKLYHSTNQNYKAVLFGEPTERKLVAGHKGIFLLTIDAQGKAAHSGYPWLGRSANSMILPALNMLDTLETVPADQGGLPGSEKFGNTTINVGLIQGGLAANVVPEHAHAEVAFRLAGGTVEENQAIVSKAIAAVDPEGLLDCEFTQGYGPVNMDTDVEGFESVTVNYGTDVPNLQVADGVKRYLFGPGSIFVAHGANEGLTVGELEAGLEDYKRLLEHALSL